MIFNNHKNVDFLVKETFYWEIMNHLETLLISSAILLLLGEKSNLLTNQMLATMTSYNTNIEGHGMDLPIFFCF